MRQVFPAVYRANLPETQPNRLWGWVRLADLAAYTGLSPEQLLEDGHAGGEYSNHTREDINLVVANCSCGSCSGDHFCKDRKDGTYEVPHSTLRPSVEIFAAPSLVSDVYVPKGWAEVVVRTHDRKWGTGFWNRPRAGLHEW